MNSAIIVAGGRGSRFNSETPKQFIEILGKPLLVHTVERFEKCPEIHEIIVVLPGEYLEEFSPALASYQMTKLRSLVSGGTTRSESVNNGLAVVDPRAEIVAVHDGARPLVSTTDISQTIEAAKISGAACLVASVTDTIKEVCDGKIVGTHDRNCLRRALTPQAFRVQILREALEQTNLDDSVTDDCMTVEKLGYKITAVEGSPHNIKVTHPEDLVIVEMYLRGGIE